MRYIYMYENKDDSTYIYINMRYIYMYENKDDSTYKRCVINEM